VPDGPHPLIGRSLDDPLAEATEVETAFHLVNERFALLSGECLEPVAHDDWVRVDLREGFSVIVRPPA
jgi:hypothetical protein